MALVNCPHCGRKVSNTAEYCVHCGKELQSDPFFGEAREYKSLSAKEIINLRDEFDCINPDFAEFKKDAKYNEKYFFRLSVICGILECIGFFVEGLDAVLAVMVFKTFFAWFAVLSILCYWALVGTFCVFIFYFFIRLRKLMIRNEIIIQKKYQVWLKENKNINYQITGIKDKYMDMLYELENEDLNKLDIRRFK